MSSDLGEYQGLEYGATANKLKILILDMKSQMKQPGQKLFLTPLLGRGSAIRFIKKGPTPKGWESN